MRETLGMLLSGDETIVRHIETAKLHWHGLLRRGIPSELDLRMAQPQFETRCGSRSLGKSLMGFVGISMLALSEADDGDLRAEDLARVIFRSSVSNEVKNAAEDVVTLLRLNWNRTQ